MPFTQQLCSTPQIEIQNAKNGGDKTLRKLYLGMWLLNIKTNMLCDSAYFYAQDNMFEAFGHIKIIDKFAVLLQIPFTTAKPLLQNSEERLL